MNALKSPSAISPFSVFAWLWSAGMIAHMASYSEPLQTITVAMLILALAVLFGFYRTTAFLMLAGVHLLYVYDRLPRVPNHSILAAAIDITILAAAAWLALTSRRLTIDTAALYRLFAPVVRIELLVLYFFVVFHKLNGGFFDPQYSCGATMYLRLAAEYPFLPASNWIRWCTIAMTILVEAAIPVLLVVRRFRLAGVLLAFAFHFALAMDPGDVVFNFSAILLALFFLFLPEDFAAAVGATLAPLRRARAATHPAVKAAILILVAPLMAALIFRDAIATGMTFEASRKVWVLYAGVVFTIFVITIRRNRFEWQSPRTLLTVPTPGLLIVPVLLFANGMMPYLGLKTETSFAMYSNLHTEGGRTNHWLMPASLQLWDYQRDLVRVRRTSVTRIQRLANRGYVWPYYEFKWLMQAHPNASVTYERNGVVKRVRKVSEEPELAPGNRVARKFLEFRPVSGRDDRTPCIH